MGSQSRIGIPEPIHVSVYITLAETTRRCVERDGTYRTKAISIKALSWCILSESRARTWN